MGRLFLDSNVLIKGFVVPWSFDRVVLKYCAARLHQMVYAEPVKIEVERFLLNYSDSHDADWLLEDYDRFIKLAQPEPTPYPKENEVIAARSLIRHAADAGAGVGDPRRARLAAYKQHGAFHARGCCENKFAYRRPAT